MQEIREKNKILIIKSDPESLAQPVAYLRNREWEIHEFTDVKQALASLLQNPPNYIFASADHSNKKVRMLRKLLETAFPAITIVAFAEKVIASSTSLMQTMDTAYAVPPPMSGPGVERVIHKIERGLTEETEQKEKHTSKSYGKDDWGGAVFISGEAKKNSHDTTYQGQSSTLSSISSQGQNYSHRNEPNTPSYIGNGEPLGGLDQKEKQSSITKAPSNHEKKENQNDIRNNKRTQQAKKNKEGTKNSTSDAIIKKKNQAPIMERDSTPQNKKQPPIMEHDSKPQNKNQPPIMEHDSKPQNKKQPPIMERGPASQKKDSSSDSIIIKATDQSISETVIRIEGDTENYVDIDTATKVACIQIESSRFAGYLIAAYGNDIKLEENFVSMLKERLVKFLKQSGEEVSEEDQMDLKLKQVEFEAWALSEAEFLRKSVHAGQALAVAFFPRQDAKLKWQDSKEQHMASIDLSEITPNTPLDFDLYVHLPANDKYIRYTGKGSMLGVDQKSRLEARGVDKMHIKKDELDGVKKHRAESYLNDSINSFKNKKKENT